MTIPSTVSECRGTAECDTLRDALAAEARDLLTRADAALEGDDLARFEAIETDLEELKTRRSQFDRIETALATGRGLVSGDGARDAGFQTQTRTDPWETTGPEQAVETRSRALTAIERWNADDVLKGSATQTIERLVDADGAPSDVRGVSEHLLRFSHPLYVSAFRKFARDPEGYAADLDADERRVWASAREYQRAALATSGAVLPSPLDPSIVLTNDGTIDPMRSVARVDTTIAKDKRYITSAGSTFSYDAELAEVSDDTFTEAEVTITTAKGQGFIQASIEAAMDQPGFDSEVAKIIADGRARLDAAQFIAGSGTDAPKGIRVALAGGASEVNAAGEALVADDVYGLLEALPPRFRANAKWQLELSTLNFLKRLYNPSGTEPALVEGGQLLSRPFVENSEIDPYSAVNPAATGNNYVLFVGDWRNYVILDRVGTSVHYIPPGHLLNTANNRPDGRVGWYCYWRTGADALTIAAFRMLDVATTA